MKLVWDEEAWEDYVNWQSEDKKTLKRINKLIKDTQRTPFSGLGNQSLSSMISPVIGAGA